MTKFLLLIGLVWLVWWVWRKSWTAHRGTRKPVEKLEPERMVQCAHCGVNQPVSESVLANGRYYCCAAHLREAQSDGA
ncbi:PP0621 family protein [Accumulibacter sp.]|uniref:Uncharacterized protein n=2 Tax=Candidatus Accumulibacter TaxID=327159 RepID=A0A080M6S2_9PROT|nr:MAG: hypothetical protein AW06_001945 [Candidatus Accumulibacter cognatus]